MSDKFKYDLVLDHSSKDSAAVRSIAERLRNDGLRVWLAEWEIDSSGKAKAGIEGALERSRALVLCVSANGSDAEWALLMAHSQRFRDPVEKERRFILVRLDDAPVRVSLAQFVPLSWLPKEREETYARLRDSCRPSRRSAVAAKVNSGVHLPEGVIHVDYDAVIETYSFNTNGSRALGACSDGVMRLWDLETGRVMRRFEGHKNMIHHVAMSADERLALSGSKDATVRLWDVATGRCLRVLRGHEGSVRSVAWSPDEQLVLSASEDNTVRLWDLATRRCVHVLKGHSAVVLGLAWSTDQLRALSSAGTPDSTVRLWDLKSGTCLNVFGGHAGKALWSVAWHADQVRFLSAATDSAVRLWDVETGRVLRVFEGHTDRIYNVAWHADQRHFLSSSDDRTVRLWDVETGRCLQVLDHTHDVMKAEWSVDGRHALSGDYKGEVRRWDLSKFLGIESESSAPSSEPEQVQYTNAKVLLVGDTGVGKTGLAERLVHERFVPTKSSHARKAHVLETRIVKEPGGVALHQETVLWDLAGQPAYRLVHQLSMEDAALACVLFDCRNETNPFEGAGYWSQVLDQSHANVRLKKLLVASRIDVGGLPASRDRIETFVREHAFSHFIPTSATTGEGCAALLEAIRREIPWKDLQKVTTTKTLAALRNFVANLKSQGRNPGANDAERISSARLLTIAALHEGFAADFGSKIPLAEFIAHLERLEASDDVELLVFHTTGATARPDDLVLLDPTRVDAYASALLVAAKDEPDGPGHLLEVRVREGLFKLDEDERIPDRESERHVLWFVMENLLHRDLALRERIKGEDYIVFPSLCTAELRFPGSAAFGVAFGFTGPVRSIYATLIAQLAHYEGFKKREFFQDAAAYRPEAGGRCLVRLLDHGQGHGDLEVLFDHETPSSVRQGFLEFVGKHLGSKSNPGSVTRRHAYHCVNVNCGEAFDDRAVRANLADRRKDLLCPFCRKKTPLQNLLAAPTAAAESVAAQIGSDARIGRQRMTAGLVIKAKEAEGKFDVFLSHNSKDKAAVERIAKRLLSVGLRPWLDKWSLPPGSTLSAALEEAIKTVPCAALCFGPADIGKWHIMEIRAYVERWASGNARMIPVILPGVKEAPELPIFVGQTVWADMRDWEKAENDGFYHLVCGILGRAPGDSPMKKFGVRNVAQWQGIRT